MWSFVEHSDAKSSHALWSHALHSKAERTVAPPSQAQGLDIFGCSGPFFLYTLTFISFYVTLSYSREISRERVFNMEDRTMKSITQRRLEENFPYSTPPRKIQEEAFERIATSDHGVLLEIPTGEGKTGIGLAALQAVGAQGKGPLFYVTPTKTQVDQVERIAGQRNIFKVLGRSEYPCLYYFNKGIPDVTAQESPCYTLRCDHRIDPQTGKTEAEGTTPCPYYLAKIEAMRQSQQGGIILCTTAFFLTNRLMVPEWQNAEPALVVVDEAHRLAKTARGVFEYTMTDFRLKRAVELLAPLDRKQAAIVSKFRLIFMRIARKRQSQTPSLLKDKEIERLIAVLDEFNASTLLVKLSEAVASCRINAVEQKEELKLLENLGHNIPRFVRSLGYALEEKGRQPLNYVVAFYYKKDDPEFQGTKRKARYYLTIRSYFVVPIIQRALGKNIVAYSATIGDSSIIKFETGINLPFYSFSSGFSIGHTRIYVPTDTYNLATRVRPRNSLNRALRQMVQMAQKFAKADHRSLVVVISEEERRKFLHFAAEAGLKVISYGDNGVTARVAAASFVAGEGQVLVGTAAQYGEGVDLPKGIAPVIFFLRPGYQRPDDPETQFEERRFSQGQCWALWNWRVMIEALQVRGRNIRTAKDLGACFFMSTQFRRFLYPALPDWLRPAYKANMTTEEAVKETLTLLS